MKNSIISKVALCVSVTCFSALIVCSFIEFDRITNRSNWVDTTCNIISVNNIRNSKITGIGYYYYTITASVLTIEKTLFNTLFYSKPYNNYTEAFINWNQTKFGNQDFTCSYVDFGNNYYDSNLTKDFPYRMEQDNILIYIGVLGMVLPFLLGLVSYCIHQNYKNHDYIMIQSFV